MKKILVHAVLFVFFAGCAPKNEQDTINTEASLPQDFGFDKMGLKTITSSINPNKNTMATLYGNGQAIADLKNSTGGMEEVSLHSENKDRILVLVTWAQKDDPYWYGAKIPGKLISMELLKSAHVLSGRKDIRYQSYDGKGIKNSLADSAMRINNILSMKPALFPSK